MSATTRTEINVTDFWRNKRVLITGGTAGLGLQLATTLLQYGAKVGVVGRSKDHLDKMPSKIIQIQADISDKEAIHKISGQALGQLDGIDVLINNASSLGPTPLQLLVDTQCEDFQQVLETNLLGPFRLIKAVLPSMLLTGKGTIINISSDAALQAYPTWGMYSVSKVALDHLTKIWQEELHRAGIQFLAVDPGDMHTQMHLDAIPDANVDELFDPKDVASDLLHFIAKEDYPQVRFTASEWRSLL